MTTDVAQLRFRFLLRTLFVVLTVVCVWLGYQLNWIHKRQKARFSFLTSGPIPAAGDLALASEAPHAPFPLRLFREQGVGFMVLKSDARREHIRDLFPESQVSIERPATQ